VYQSKSNYSISGTTLTFTTAPPSGTAVEAITHTQTSINTPANGSVAPASIASGDFYFSNNLGIGTSSPMVDLNIHDTSTPRVALTNSTTGQTFPAGFELLVSGSDAYVSQRENANLIFSTNNTERMRILSSGGITFNGDTAAANALDDYEEGTYQAELRDASGNSIAGAFFGYTKIGKVVTVHGEDANVNVSGLTTTDELRMSLPFTADSTAGGDSCGVVQMQTLDTSLTNPDRPIVANVGQGNDYVTFNQISSTASGQTLLVSHFRSGGTTDIRRFMIVYHAA